MARVRLFVVFAVACLALTASAAKPPITKLILVGDIHADYNKLLLVLEKAGFLPNRNLPITLVPPAGTAIAFLGDTVDRAPPNPVKNDIEVFNFIHGLRQAHPDNVFLVMGNHEAMLLNRDFQYCPYLNVQHPPQPLQATITDLTHCAGTLNGAFRSLPGLLKLGKTVIAHGGPSKEWADYLYTLAKGRVGTPKGEQLVTKFNKLLSRELDEVCARAEANGPKHHPYKIISTATDALCPNTSPLWYRGFSDITQAEIDENLWGRCCRKLLEEEAPLFGSPALRLQCQYTGQAAATAAATIRLCEAVDATLARFQADRLVMAHTPQPTGIRSLCNGRVFFIDVGLSDFFRNTGAAPERPEFLVLEEGQAPKKHVIEDDGTVTPTVLPNAGPAICDLGDISCRLALKQFGDGVPAHVRTHLPRCTDRVKLKKDSAAWKAQNRICAPPKPGFLSRVGTFLRGGQAPAQGGNQVITEVPDVDE